MRNAIVKCPECGEELAHRGIPNHYAERHPDLTVAVLDPATPREPTKGGRWRWTDDPWAVFFYLNGEGMADLSLGWPAPWPEG